MNPEYNDSFGMNNSSSYWKTKYYKVLHKYYQLLNHCGTYFNDGDDDDDDHMNNHNNDKVNLLTQKNNQLLKTIMSLQKEIKHKIPMGPPLHPVDMSMNVPRVIHLYTHPEYYHKIHKDISMNNIPHHIYPHPIPIPHHPPLRPVMPQHAHIPPPKPPVKPVNKDILDYPYYNGYFNYGYPYSYPYGYPYGYPYNYYPYYRDINTTEKPHNKPPPPIHPVLQHPI